MFSKMRAPRCSAPLANACVVSTGLVRPSLGSHTAPTTSLASISGHSAAASRAVITSTSKPNTRAMEAPRFSSSKRSALLAIDTEPFCRKPVGWPVSASNVASRLEVYCASCVRLRVARSWPTSPAACHVVPDVRRLRSSSTTSVRLSLVR
ncbi:sarcosine dehydrogenase, mitochondrial [Anaerolineaceae bacterium]|nr:sarcosine dehydrogenase, mitochondrial [Anaerolineaceae bacterium]